MHQAERLDLKEVKSSKALRSKKVAAMTGKIWQPSNWMSPSDDVRKRKDQ